MDIGGNKMTTYHVPRIGASFKELGERRASEQRRWWNNYWGKQLTVEEDKLVFRSQSGQYDADKNRVKMERDRQTQPLNPLFEIIDEANRERLKETKKRIELN